MAEEKYNIRCTSHAIGDYNRVLNFLQENWSVKVAANYIDKVEQKIFNLSGQPFMGIVSEKNPTIRSILLTKHNRLYYRVKNSTIELGMYLQQYKGLSN